MINAYAEAKKRIPSQIKRIVNMLKEAGEQGVTNVELSKVGLGYRSRLSELYRMGYKIDCGPLENGVCKYILRKEPGDIKHFMNATDEIMMELDEHFAEELKALLEEKNFHIVRRNGFWKDEKQ